MTRLTLVLLAVCLLAPSAAADGWRDFDGQPAPAITATQWLHVPEGSPSVKSLKGKVWLLNFIGIH